MTMKMAICTGMRVNIWRDGEMQSEGTFIPLLRIKNKHKVGTPSVIVH